MHTNMVYISYKKLNTNKNIYDSITPEIITKFLNNCLPDEHF